MQPFLSVIIPSYNEYEIIENTVKDCLDKLPHDDCEIIISDQSSIDDTRTSQIVSNYVAKYDCVLYHRSTWINRATTMNQWASKASWKIYVFLHADCRLPNDVYKQLKWVDLPAYPYWWFLREMKPAKVATRIADWFGKNLASRFWYFLWDNAQFVDASLFQEVGWFQDLWLFEDVNLSLDLKKKSKERWTHWILIWSPVVSSSRKFIDHGQWKMFFLMLWMQIWFFCWVPVKVMADWYRKL